MIVNQVWLRSTLRAALRVALLGTNANTDTIPHEELQLLRSIDLVIEDPHAIPCGIRLTPQAVSQLVKELVPSLIGEDNLCDYQK